MSGGAYDDVDEEMDVSEANIFVSEAKMETWSGCVLSNIKNVAQSVNAAKI